MRACQSRAAQRRLGACEHRPRLLAGPLVWQVLSVPCFCSMLGARRQLCLLSAGNIRESMLLAYTTVTETALVGVADLLRLNVALRWATPKLEAAYASVTGTHPAEPVAVLLSAGAESGTLARRRRAQDGRRLADTIQVSWTASCKLAALARRPALSKLCAGSLVNNTSPGFEAGPYSPREFPFAEPWHPERHLFQPNVAHFMSLCMKLIYEQPEVIQARHLEAWCCLCQVPRRLPPPSTPFHYRCQRTAKLA